MSKYILHIICCAAIALMACTGQVTSTQNSTKTIDDSSAIQSHENDTTQADTPAENNAALTKIYCRAIADYITAVSKQNLLPVDTLFFGKRNNGQPDDFPNIVLPETINNTSIRLVDPAIGEKLQQEKASRIYINLMGWVDTDKAEFIFITFSNGFEHKFDCNIDYKYNLERKEFELVKSRVEMFGRR